MENSNATTYSNRARYLTLDQGFNKKLAPVPAHIFLAERDDALAETGGSKEIPCDLNSIIGGPVPTTTPLVLASYIRIESGHSLSLRSAASAEIFYVIRGSGTTRWGSEQMAWETGDVMLFPGGIDETLSAHGDTSAVLWRCTNAPQLAFEGALPPPADQSVIKPTHYPKAAMMHALAEAKKLTMANGMKSMAIMFGSESVNQGTISPSLTLALNSVPPKDSQVPHRHNSAAVTLVLEGTQCYSLVEGQKVPWSQFATFVTPGAASHSHHNQAEDNALLLIVQDGGLYNHCRTMGFAITEA